MYLLKLAALFSYSDLIRYSHSTMYLLKLSKKTASNYINKENNGQKRWNHIFKICKRYLSHIQNSVFEGDITKVQLVKLKQELTT